VRAEILKSCMATEIKYRAFNMTMEVEVKTPDKE
jgi:hypothetical protein